MPYTPFYPARQPRPAAMLGSVGHLHQNLSWSGRNQSNVNLSAVQASQTIGNTFDCDEVLRFVNSNISHVDGSRQMQGNADIAGLGVILAFLISAYSVSILIVAGYFLGFLPANLLQRMDRQMFFARVGRENSRWPEAFREIIMMFSDQQLITGIGILLAGYGSLAGSQPLDQYHWQVVIHLAWMSSNVHLAALTALRPWLRASPAIGRLRLVGMIVMLVLLLGAMLPTLANGWAAQDLPSTQYNKWNTEFNFLIQTPVHCYWTRPLLYGMPPTSRSQSVLSISWLVLGYMWRLLHYHDGSRNTIRRYARAGPQILLEKTLMFAQSRGLEHSTPHSVVWRVLYHLAALTYVLFILLADFAESLAASICYIFFLLTWSLLQVVLSRLHVPPQVVAAERKWGFGQLLPLFLLLQPLFTLIGYLFKGQRHRPSPGENQAQTEPKHDVALGVGDEEMQQKPLTYLQTEHGASLSAAIKLQHESMPYLPTSTLDSGPPTRLLYSSRLFKALARLVLAGTISIGVLINCLESWNPVPLTMQPADRPETHAYRYPGLALWENVFICVSYSLLALFATTCIGSLFSRAFR